MTTLKDPQRHCKPIKFYRYEKLYTRLMFDIKSIITSNDSVVSHSINMCNLSSLLQLRHLMLHPISS